MSKSETDALKDKVCTFTGVYFSGAQNISSEIFISESNKARQQFQTAELHYLYRVFLFLFSRWLPPFWPELINWQYLTMVSGGVMAKDHSWWESLDVATPSSTIRGFISVAAGCFVLLMAVPMGWYSCSSMDQKPSHLKDHQVASEKSPMGCADLLSAWRTQCN